MREREIPYPSPATIASLVLAGEELDRQVRGQVLHCPRPVFMFYIVQTLDALVETLSTHRIPLPTTPAQQLCLHLIIERAEHTANGDRPDLTHVRGTVLPGYVPAALPAHIPEGSSAAERSARKPGEPYDFVALAGALTSRGMSAFFAPAEPGELVA